MIRIFSIAVLLTLAFSPPLVRAGTFDCSVVYDEFDQLMMANFLVNPRDYVETVDNQIFRDEHILYQLERFKLREGRELVGVAIVRTNQNLRGKMTFVWQRVAWEDAIPVEVDDLILYGRVRDGYAPVHYKSIYLTPNFAIDLDTGQIVETDDESADLSYEFDGEIHSLRAIEPAEAYFPVDSMCEGYADETDPLLQMESTPAVDESLDSDLVLNQSGNEVQPSAAEGSTAAAGSEAQ